MLTTNFDFDSATKTIVVDFPIQPIAACYADSLTDHLFETVLFPRNCADEHLYVGSDFMPISKVADVIRYQFGDIYEAENSSGEIAALLRQESDVWLRKQGGYDNVKA